MIRIRPFKKKEKEVKKISTQWLMEGFNVWWPMEGEGEPSFHLFPLSHQKILLKPSFFPLILRFYFTMVLGRYLRISFIFLDL
jgi:hypothetical protein